jgi:transposase-like protein
VLPLKRSLLIVIAARKSSVDEALIKMYMAGVSVRRVKNIMEAMWEKVSPYTISELKKKAYVHRASLTEVKSA